MPKEVYTKIKHHHLRTFFASLFAVAGVYLVLSSITAIWINQTLTNTTTYVNTVAPLVAKPAIQKYLAEKVTNIILNNNNSSIQTFELSLLPASAAQANLTTAQVNSMVEPIIESNVLSIIQSPSFAQLWRSTNQTAHAELISQLNSNSPQISLDLSPAINGVLAELKSTQLSPIVSQINVKPSSGNLVIKNSNISKVHRYYRLYKASTILLIVLAVISIGLSILLSLHKMKTIRRILLWVGILALLQAIILDLPKYLKFSGNDPTTTNAIRTLIEALFHDLLLVSIIVAAVGIGGYIGLKLYSHFTTKK